MINFSRGTIFLLLRGGFLLLLCLALLVPCITIVEMADVHISAGSESTCITVDTCSAWARTITASTDINTHFLFFIGALSFALIPFINSRLIYITNYILPPVKPPEIMPG